MEKAYTFRKITNKEELTQFFKLRYAVYEQSDLQAFISINGKKMDIDVYDIHSHHYGLFKGNEIAGYIRLVVGRKGYCNPAILTICKENGFFENDLSFQNGALKNCAPSYPFLGYPGVPPVVKDYYNSIKSDYPIIEASRLVIPENHRGVRAGLRMIELATIAAMQLIGNGKGYVIIDCATSQEKVYGLFGFKRLPGLKDYYVFDVMKGKSLCLSLSLSLSLCLSDIPAKMHDRFYGMSEEFVKTNKIVRH